MNKLHIHYQQNVATVRVWISRQVHDGLVGQEDRHAHLRRARHRRSTASCTTTERQTAEDECKIYANLCKVVTVARQTTDERVYGVGERDTTEIGRR